jgi:hypothetical protein
MTSFIFHQCLFICLWWVILVVVEDYPENNTMFFFFFFKSMFFYRLEQIYTRERIFVSPYTYLHIFFIIIFHNCATYIIFFLRTHICFYTDQVMLHNLYSSYTSTHGKSLGQPGFYSLTWAHKIRFPGGEVSSNPKIKKIYTRIRTLYTKIQIQAMTP